MKTAKVCVTLAQKRSRFEISNCKPISLVPTISKVLEKKVLARLKENLTTNELLTDRQLGFIKGRPILTALVGMLESIIEDLDDGKKITGVFVDMSKGF